MKTEPMSKNLLRRLDASVGRHAKIAKEAGVSQASISRYYLRKTSPNLRNAERLMAWYEAEDQRLAQSALRLPHAQCPRLQCAGTAATPALAHPGE